MIQHDAVQSGSTTQALSHFLPSFPSFPTLFPALAAVGLIILAKKPSPGALASLFFSSALGGAGLRAGAALDAAVGGAGLRVVEARKSFVESMGLRDVEARKLFVESTGLRDVEARRSGAGCSALPARAEEDAVGRRRCSEIRPGRVVALAGDAGDAFEAIELRREALLVLFVGAFVASERAAEALVAWMRWGESLTGVVGFREPLLGVFGDLGNEEEELGVFMAATASWLEPLVATASGLDGDAFCVPRLADFSV